jgi:hypothetical protein
VHTEETKREEAKGMLHILAGKTERAMLNLQSYPPTNPANYTKWLLAAFPESRSIRASKVLRFDDQTGRFVDPWGKPIVLMIDQDRLVALASGGQNRRWDDGAGDDIVLRLSEVGVFAEPPGTPWPEPQS